MSPIWDKLLKSRPKAAALQIGVTEGKVRKGGQNKTSKVVRRPAAPASMKARK